MNNFDTIGEMEMISSPFAVMKKTKGVIMFDLGRELSIVGVIMAPNNAGSNIPFSPANQAFV